MLFWQSTTEKKSQNTTVNDHSSSGNWKVEASSNPNSYVVCEDDTDEKILEQVGENEVEMRLVEDSV